MKRLKTGSDTVVKLQFIVNVQHRPRPGMKIVTGADCHVAKCTHVGSWFIRWEQNSIFLILTLFCDFKKVKVFLLQFI